MVNTITAFPEDTTQIEVIKAFMNALKIKFTVAQKKEKPYDPAFVAKIRQSQQDYKDGKFKTIKPNEINKFLGLE